jgi:hypothetical protein
MITTETMLPLTEVPSALPRSRGAKSGRVAFSTVLRWVVKGVQGPNGKIVRLEALRVGGRWITSHEAIGRFAERLTPAFAAKPEAVPRSAGRQRRAAERAGRKLERFRI